MSELRSIVAEIERIRDAKKDLAKDESRQFAAAKAADIDGKALRTVLKRRAMGAAAAREFDDLVTMYENALGGKAVAAKAIKAGATVREAAKIAGIGYGTAQRSKTQVLDHDPATGEITESTGGGDNSSDAGNLPTAAPGTIPPGVPPVEPDAETDCAQTPGAHPQAEAVGVAASADPDEGWQARDGHDSYVLALQVANGKVPHPADASHIMPLQPDRTAVDAPLELPAYLRAGTPENRKARGLE